METSTLIINKNNNVSVRFFDNKYFIVFISNIFSLYYII